MREAIAAVRAALSAEDYDAYYVSVPESPTFPYVLLWTSGGTPAYEVLSDERWLGGRLGVTCVALSPEAVLAVVETTRGVLEGLSPASTVWNVDALRLMDSQDVQPDRDVTIPETNRPPFFAVDLYRFTATPK